MKRIKLSNTEENIKKDKTILERFRNNEISKSDAMAIITMNNHSPEMITEEYFDYLMRLGYR